MATYLEPGIYCGHIDLFAIEIDDIGMTVRQEGIPNDKIINTVLFGHDLIIDLNEMTATLICNGKEEVHEVTSYNEFGVNFKSFKM